jgi:hypothetical protein
MVATISAHFIAALLRPFRGNTSQSSVIPVNWRRRHQVGDASGLSFSTKYALVFNLHQPPRARLCQARAPAGSYWLCHAAWTITASGSYLSIISLLRFAPAQRPNWSQSANSIIDGMPCPCPHPRPMVGAVIFPSQLHQSRLRSLRRWCAWRGKHRARATAALHFENNGRRRLALS